jgi:polyisoprenoid-binding protein YceI
MPAFTKALFRTMMKHLFTLLPMILSFGIPVLAQEYKPTDTGSAVQFEIKNFGINTNGSFGGLDGKIVFDPKNVAGASFDVSIDAATINTGYARRDDHLNKESYFDVEKYPRIRLVSTGVTGPDKSGHYILNGKLTIKATTKDVSFPFVVTTLGDDLIFKGDFPLNRRDFDVGGSSPISNDLRVSLTVLAKKQ